MKRIFAIFALVSCSAFAEPVHLTCQTISPNGSPGTITLTLDESAGTVVFTDDIAKGLSFKVPAQFTQTEVLFKNHQMLGMSLTMTYMIDRINGTITHYISKERPSSGPCTKSTQVARKF